MSPVEKERMYNQGEKLHLMNHTDKKHRLIYCIYNQGADSGARHSVSDTHSNTHTHSHIGHVDNANGDIHTYTWISALVQLHTHTHTSTHLLRVRSCKCKFMQQTHETHNAHT